MFKGKENRSSKATLPQFNEGNIEDYMEILYNHQKQCQKSGKYLEADLAKKKLTQMKSELEKHRKGDMINKHQQEKKQVQSAHLQEMNQFNKYWDQKMLEYQQQAEKLQDQALDRHQSQMEQYHQQIQKSLGFKQKQSSQIINLRKIQDNLAKQQNYIEAHKVQKQIQQLQRGQYQKWNQVRTIKIKNLLTQLKNKQQNQINALRQRIQQGFQQQKKIRIQQQQKLIQKYMNFIKELQTHHHQEMMKLDKSAKMQSTMGFSRQSSNVSNMSRVSQS